MVTFYTITSSELNIASTVKVNYKQIVQACPNADKL